jgi:hypothetical protein
MSVQLQIRRDVGGTWSVHGLSPEPMTGLPSLSASIDYARRQCGAAPATIELMIDGFYAVVQQERGWPRQLVAPAKEPVRQALGGIDAGNKARFWRPRGWSRDRSGLCASPVGRPRQPGCSDGSLPQRDAVACRPAPGSARCAGQSRF